MESICYLLTILKFRYVCVGNKNIFTLKNIYSNECISSIEWSGAIMERVIWMSKKSRWILVITMCGKSSKSKQTCHVCRVNSTCTAIT